jgi:hypothetical protein
MLSRDGRSFQLARFFLTYSYPLYTPQTTKKTQKTQKQQKHKNTKKKKKQIKPTENSKKSAEAGQASRSREELGWVKVSAIPEGSLGAVDPPSGADGR